MFKVGIIGPEASGKTTLAQYLSKRYSGIFIPEYAREWVEKHSKDVSYDDLCHIAKQQIEQLKELEKKEEDRIAFFDTELIITKVWFDYAFGKIPEWLNEAIDQYPMNIYLLTYPDLEWVQDGTRYNGSDDIRWELFERYEQEIQKLNIPYYIIQHND